MSAPTFAALAPVLAARPAPLAFVDLDAFDANARALTALAGGLPVRVATKSVRCTALTKRALDAPGLAFRGVLAFTVAEALHLADHGVRDALVAYPSVDAAGLRELARRIAAGEALRTTCLVDAPATVAPVAAAARGAGVELPVCLDVDAGWWPVRGRLARIGAKRSPVRTPAQAAQLAAVVALTPGVRVAGLMAYDGQVAGVGDAPPGRRARALAIRAMQASSLRDLGQRVPAVVAAVERALGEPVGFVNCGGTGSLARMAAAGTATELAAGSGLYAPTLFDGYRGLALQPAAGFALPVVRRPGPGVAALLGGGYVASGPPGADRVPSPVWPPGLRLDSAEGAGEVQTPVLGPAADALAPGDQVLLRHAKAGELCERFASLLLIQGGQVVDEVPTYRGEGRTFL